MSGEDFRRIDWWSHLPLMRWLASGERGISSETIVAALTGVVSPRMTSEPYDPDDFRRCERLLREVPLLRFGFAQVADVSPAWAALVKRWDEINAVCEEEVGPGWPRPCHGRRAPRAYKLIQECRGVSS